MLLVSKKSREKMISSKSKAIENTTRAEDRISLKASDKEMPWIEQIKGECQNIIAKDFASKSTSIQV